MPDHFLQPYTKKKIGGASSASAAASADGEGGAAAAAAEAAEEAKAAAEDVAFFAPRLKHHLKAERSEPLTTLSLFEEWQKALHGPNGQARAAQYCHAQHASYKRLAEIDALARELLQKIRQQRREHQMPLLPPGHLLVGAHDTSDGKG